MAEWLVQNLYKIFQIPKALGASWIKEEQLTLCLDGLDEVAAQDRNDCVQALNHFLQTHGRTEVVVCSRIRDYEALSEQLGVRCAICVQPLSSQQIDQYLVQAGEQLSVLSSVFSRNPEIMTLATSPLILSVMSLAYQGYSLDEFPEMNSAQSFRQQLFDIYIERMFLRREKTNCCTDEQAKHWLVWMAQHMVQSSQTVFFLENMQPSLLKTQKQRERYRAESMLIYGFCCGLIYGLPYSLGVDLSKGIDYGLSTGITAMAFAWNLDEIKTVETLKWSWTKGKKAFNEHLCISLAGGIFIGLLIGLIGIIGLSYGWRDGLVFGLTIGILGGLVYGLIFGLILGTSRGLIGPSMDNKTKPNQGIWKSVQNSWKLALMSGFIGGLSGGIFPSGLPIVLRIGLAGVVIGGSFGGGLACIRHFSLRLMLCRMGYIPLNYARFLDYAAERLFLQKVGSGYIFIHRMLLEHFAQMTLEKKLSK